MPKIHMMEQRSEEWFAHRRGKLTASRISDTLAKTRSGWGASRDRYMTELILERFGIQREPFTTPDMEWGTQTEPEARSVYEYLTDATVSEVGFVDHDTIPMLGCSPDGFVGDDGLVEIKCPASHTHMNTLISDKIDGKYIQQMHCQMMICDRKWCDFVSFDPRMPPHLQIFIRRIEAQDDYLELGEDCDNFLRELERKMEALENVEPIANVA